jgi:hypothetical protein
LVMENSYETAKYIGIDAGKDGGLFWIDREGSFLGCCRMPTTSEGDTDFLGVARILHKMPKDVMVITEQLHSLGLAGKKATFSFARQTALLECAILVNKLAWTKVLPKKWQSKMWLGMKMHTKTIKLDAETTKYKTDTKLISENAFRRLFPQLIEHPAIKKVRSPRLHDGVVDAGLLALYGKRENL